jgi:hypothetical protein
MMRFADARGRSTEKSLLPVTVYRYRLLLLLLLFNTTRARAPSGPPSTRCGRLFTVFNSRIHERKVSADGAPAATQKTNALAL